MGHDALGERVGSSTRIVNRWSCHIRVWRMLVHSPTLDAQLPWNYFVGWRSSRGHCGSTIKGSGPSWEAAFADGFAPASIQENAAACPAASRPRVACPGVDWYRAGLPPVIEEQGCPWRKSRLRIRSWSSTATR